MSFERKIREELARRGVKVYTGAGGITWMDPAVSIQAEPSAVRIDKPNLGTVYRRARRAAGLTIREAAERAGVGVAIIAGLENGSVEVEAPTRLAILAAIDEASRGRLSP